MAPPESCMNCKYSIAISQVQALCRRLPPTPVPVQINPNESGVRGAFPPVEPTTWCGEWKPALLRAHSLDASVPPGFSRNMGQ